jgi:hypothetical protein
MMQRRAVIKGAMGLATASLLPRSLWAAPSKVRVTLVRWPYT